MSSSTSSSKRAVWVVAGTSAAGFLALAAGSEWFVRDQVAPVDTFRRHVAFFHQAGGGDVAFGDSHVARGFPAGSGFINLAFPSENIIRQAWKARRYFARRAPGRVILQADPHLFAAYRLRVPLAPYPLAFGNKGLSAPLYLFDQRHRWRILEYWEAALRNGGELVSNVRFSKHGALLSGGDLSTLAPRARRLEALQRARLHRPLDPKRWAASARTYAELVQWLIRRGARVCMVAYPVSPDYLEAIAQQPPDARRNWQRAHAFFKDVARTSGARYVDLRRWSTDRSLFRDVDHLNLKGAPRFLPDILRRCFGRTTAAAPNGPRATPTAPARLAQ